MQCWNRTERSSEKGPSNRRGNQGLTIVGATRSRTTSLNDYRVSIHTLQQSPGTLAQHRCNGTPSTVVATQTPRVRRILLSLVHHGHPTPIAILCFPCLLWIHSLFIPSSTYHLEQLSSIMLILVVDPSRWAIVVANRAVRPLSVQRTGCQIHQVYFLVQNYVEKSSRRRWAVTWKIQS